MGAWPRRCVGIGEVPPFEQWDAERPKVIGAHDDIGHGREGRFGPRLAFDLERVIVSSAVWRQGVRKSRRRDPRQAAHTLQHASVTCALRRNDGLGISAIQTAGGNAHGQDLPRNGLEPCIGLLQLHETAEQQTGSNQQRERQRHFRYRQHTVGTPSGGISRPGSAALL